MAFRRPQLQQQFQPRDSTSAYDCAATTGGMMADADSRGTYVFNHAEVRRKTNEPRPDARSPGLTIQQVRDSLDRLTSGKVAIEVHAAGSPWKDVPEALQQGKWALLAYWRGVIVDAGYGGSSPFRGGHASIYGYDQNDMDFILGDPLTPRWLHVPTTVMERACREFLIRAGVGAGYSGAYYGFTRDVFSEEDDETGTSGDETVFNIGPLTTHRDAVLKAGTVLYKDSALTTRYSAVDKETSLGFLGSGNAFHVVGNSGNSNYVRRADVKQIVTRDRTYE